MHGGYSYVRRRWFRKWLLLRLVGDREKFGDYFLFGAVVSLLLIFGIIGNRFYEKRVWEPDVDVEKR